MIRAESLHDDEPEDEASFGTFREFRKEAGSFGIYQKRLFVLMGCYWITASFFLILPFYFFKRPLFCANQDPTLEHCEGIHFLIRECLQECAQQLCAASQANIKHFIIN